MSDKYVSFLEQFSSRKNTIPLQLCVFEAQQSAQHLYLQYQKSSKFAEIKLGVPLLPIARI